MQRLTVIGRRYKATQSTVLCGKEVVLQASVLTTKYS